MSNNHENTISGLQKGNISDVNKVMERFFQRVVIAAEKRISERKKRILDGEDIAASVFESLWKDAAEGGLQDAQIADENDLWRYLSKLTRSKVIDHARRENAQKRGGGKVRGNSVFISNDNPDKQFEIENQNTFTPDELVEFQESHATLLNQLDDERLQEIATLRMEGFEVIEIANRIGLSDRSVKRKLAIIRDTWKDYLQKRDG